MLFKAYSLHQEGTGGFDWKNTEGIKTPSEPQSGTDLPHEERVLSAFTVLQTVSVFPLLRLYLLLLQRLVCCVFTISK